MCQLTDEVQIDETSFIIARQPNNKHCVESKKKFIFLVKSFCRDFPGFSNWSAEYIKMILAQVGVTP